MKPPVIGECVRRKSPSFRATVFRSRCNERLHPMAAPAPIPIQSEPPTLVDERARVWRTLAGFENGAPFWLLLRCARLPAGRVRHALRQLTAVGDVIAKSERGEIRYCIR